MPGKPVLQWWPCHAHLLISAAFDDQIVVKFVLSDLKLLKIQLICNEKGFYKKSKYTCEEEFLKTGSIDFHDKCTTFENFWQPIMRIYS